MNKSIIGGISLWLVAKSLVNLVLNFGFGNIIGVVVAVALAGALIIKVPYANYIVAVVMAIGVIKNLPYNLAHFQIIYLAEAIVDAVCVFILVANKEVRDYFKSE